LFTLCIITFHNKRQKMKLISILLISFLNLLHPSTRTSTTTGSSSSPLPFSFFYLSFEEQFLSSESHQVNSNRRIRKNEREKNPCHS
jgi:hypothetical protein